MLIEQPSGGASSPGLLQDLGENPRVNRRKSHQDPGVVDVVIGYEEGVRIRPKQSVPLVEIASDHQRGTVLVESCEQLL